MLGAAHSQPPVPVILDVDTGVDDALALALGVRSERVDLVAVTTVAGNVGVAQATANTLTVLDWLGATGVPVHRGASHPLVRAHEDASFVHGTDGLGNADLPRSSRDVAADRGPAAMVRLLRERPGEIALVAVGPLTNVAIALNVEPRIAEWAAQLVVMGGAYREPGNVTPRAEYNLYADPEAAAQVFAAPWRRLVAVGLDVSHRTPLSRRAWEAARDRPNPAAQLVHRVCARTFTERALDGFYLHDPLALAVAIDPTLVTLEPATVAVGLEGDARGETRITGPGDGLVATGVDAPRFLAAFGGALGLPEAD